MQHYKYEVVKNENNLEVRIQDKYNQSKVHAFRFYKDRHITYNQLISGSVFYPRWVRLRKNFGYASVRETARFILENHSSEEILESTGESTITFIRPDLVQEGLAVPVQKLVNGEWVDMYLSDEKQELKFFVILNDDIDYEEFNLEITDGKNIFRAISIDWEYDRVIFKSGDCEDCGEPFCKRDLRPWKYEAEVKLCENCFETRIIEDEEV